MRTILATAALTLAVAAPASAEFFPIGQPAPSPPCGAGGPGTGAGVAAPTCAPLGLVPVTRAQVKLIVAYKVRAIWGRDAARHIRRYGCDLYRLPDEVGQTTTSCMTTFRSRRHRTVTRHLVLIYGASATGALGVTVMRFPRDAPDRGAVPPPTGSTGSTGPTAPTDTPGDSTTTTDGSFVAPG